MGGDQFSKVSGVKGIYEAAEQTMPISAVITESPSPVANISTALWGDRSWRIVLRTLTCETMSHGPSAFSLIPHTTDSEPD